MEQVGGGADDPRPGQRTAPGSLVHASPPLNCTQWYKYNGTCECAKHSESFAVCTCFLLRRSPVSQAARIDGGQTRQREELPMAKQVIAVLGGTGGQGGGVVEALLGLGQFTVRVASRNPAGDAAKALARRGVEVVKADLLDAAVEAAGFPRYTFVQAPMYFQNFLTMNTPQPLPGGGRGWAVPMDPAARVMHAGDVTEVGRAVAAAFAAGDKVPNGTYLAVCGGVYSWNDFVVTLNAQGHELQVTRVPPEAYDSFFPGARELREMYQYYEQHTYFGPEREKRIAAARALVPGGFTGFADWAKVHMKPS